MNWDQIEGQWKTYKGKVKERWGKLTDSDMTVIEGKRDQLVGHLQRKYGVIREEAERQIDDFLEGFETPPTTVAHDDREITRRRKKAS